MRLRRVFDIAGCACGACFFLNAHLCEISGWTVAFFLGTVVYGTTVLYRAVRSTPCGGSRVRLLGLLDLLRRRHNDG